MAAVWAALYYCTWLFLGDCRVKLVAAAASDKKRNCVRALVEAHCPSLADPKKARYVPTPYLIGGMLQTVYCAYIALRRDKKSNIKYERELRTMRDGGTVSLDWYPGRIDDAKSTQPIVIVLSGLGGSSYEYHIRCLAKHLAVTTDGGMRVVVANHRGCGRTPLTSSQLYNGHDTSDLTEVIAHVSKMFPCAPLACIGFSLGSNLVMRYLGEAGDHTPLAAAVGVCCPFDTVTTGHMMNKPGFLNDNLFQPALMRTLKRTVSRNLDMIRSGNVDYDIDAIMRAKRMSEIDNAITAKAYGFKDCWEYYAAVSPIDSVDSIRRPFLAINTHDDPITPVAGVPLDKFESNPHTAAAIVDYGGHLGFFTGIPARIWFLDPVAEFLAAALAESGDRPPC
ncbi:hypothetical protein IWQ57_001507 [Coemansia nantahalensis]|uniref:Uncharacterized protein n=1 Tax=Coemansia nantahalensis TaxID=2789366 RepID=A0ACC1K427_9FUNG|nr:hypothetical protein IWQ57_001507 [Coemansia nantahalensis]